MPYRLFALSNAGSMAGLLTYPILVEPYLTNRAQAWMWSTAYAAFAMTFPDSEHAAAAHRELSGQQWAALDDEAAAGRSLLGYGGVAAGSPSSTQLPLWRAEY